MIRRIPLAEYANQLQSKTISASGTDTVWTYTVPRTMMLFLTAKASNIFNSGLITLVVDGQTHQSLGIQLGDLNNPYRMDPPLVVNSTLQVIVKNNDTASHTYDVFFDGFLVMRGDIYGD